jgi:hypothetical protein
MCQQLLSLKSDIYIFNMTLEEQSWSRSLPIITNVVSSNPAHGKVYLIQHYVITFVRDLRQVDGFLWVFPVSSTNKTDCRDITEILLKMAYLQYVYKHSDFCLHI